MFVWGNVVGEHNVASIAFHSPPKANIKNENI